MLPVILNARHPFFAFCLFFLTVAILPRAGADPNSEPVFPGTVKDYNGYECHDFQVDNCSVHIVVPKTAQSGRKWVWRTMFWNAYPSADIALLNNGYYLAFIDVGNTFGCPDAMKHFDAFYNTLTTTYGMSTKPALEGLSRGGLYAYRWASVNADHVGCLYGDAPVCDMKSWPGGKGTGKGSASDWAKAIQCYHFSGEKEMLDFKGNPIDILAPIAAAHVPIIHVCGDSDKTVPEKENSDIVRERYIALGGEFVLIVKEGCDHHPHGLADPTPVVNFIMAHCSEGAVAEDAKKLSPAPGSIVKLPKGKW